MNETAACTVGDALVTYHYLRPDDVVSSILVSELCEGLAQRGWRVRALPSNRGCRQDETYPSVLHYRGVQYERIWRPKFPQSRAWGRLANAAWMIMAWSIQAFISRQPPDVLIMGTDPVLSIIALLAWRTRSRRTVLAHWCFDLYPEAAVADGLVANNSLVVRAARRLLGRAYSTCDLIADIGPCMRTRLERYKPHARMLSLVPWALEEPSEPLETDIAERCAVFGEARLALFYSGSFGRAHSCKDLLVLSALIEDFGGVLAFSVRGNCEAELRAAVEKYPSVRLVPFVQQDRLSKRLSAADIHVVTLREEWTGTVVPSKFFAALAVGRPVLFAGSEDSSVARWIRQFGVGWVLNAGNCRDVAAEMQFLAERPAMLQALFRRCWFVYQEQFSKKTTIDRWDAELKQLLNAKKSEKWA